MTGLIAPDADPTRATVRIQTLGGVGLFAANSGELLLGMGKPLALLIYLALAPGQRSSRESLIALLWSDVDTSRARNALRQALFLLRRILGDDAIPGSEELALLRRLAIDRDVFQRALERADLTTAVDAYRGPFVPDFGAPGGEEFEAWASLERARLQAGFVRAAELLVRRLMNESRLSEAKQLARSVRERAPDAEAAGRLLLEVHLASRDVLSATMEANAIEQWAAAKGDGLESATRAAIARARRGAPIDDDEQSAPTLVAELTGRGREFSLITSSWEVVRSGVSRHVHVTASAGIGKSRLLRDVVARLEASGAAVVQLRGHPGDRELPYAFAGDLAGALAKLPGAAGVAPNSIASLLSLNPALSSQWSGDADLSTGEEALRRRTLALTELVHAVADSQRFVMAVDDLHWIDPLSWRLLEGVWSRTDRARMLCLTASRSERAPTSDACIAVPLAPLTVAHIRSLVSTLGALTAAFPAAESMVQGLFDATHGSPLLVLETLKHALDQRILALDDGEWRCCDASRLASLLRAGEALRERVRALPATSLALLALLATVGAPVERAALGTLSGSSATDLAAALEPLERMGLVTASGTSMAPAHDEIGSAAIDALPIDLRIAGEVRVGAHFAERTGVDANDARRAAHHLVAAGDTVALQRLFREHARRARFRGDRRAFRILAGELVGSAASTTLAAQLVDALPFSWRVGLWSPLRQTAATLALLLLPAASIGALLHGAGSDPTLQRLVFEDSSARATSGVRTVLARPEEWDGRTTAVHASADASTYADVGRRNTTLFAAPISPDGRAVAWTDDAGDSTTLEIFLRTPSGTRRLSKHVRDDVASDWMPDGSALVGATERWATPDAPGYDIAMYDTSTGAARPVTRGPGHDGVPRISPDGTRVLYIRESQNLRTRACVTTIDGAREAVCRLINGNAVAQVVGWTTLDEVVLILDSAGTRPLVAYDWARNSERLLIGSHAQMPRISPDRQWVSAMARADGMVDFREWIIPVERPTLARTVDGVGRNARRWWEGVSRNALLIDHLVFTDSATAISVGIGSRLHVRQVNVAGTEIPARVPLTWRSSDTLVATIDSTGEVHARAQGSVTISASLVGWRTTSKRFHVDDASSAIALHERWDDQWTTRWIPWGTPQPIVVDGPAGVRAFFNNGDGSYPSMAVSRQSFDARRGLGLEVRLSTPLTESTRQRLRTLFVSGVDTTALLMADQQKSPPFPNESDRVCGMAYPSAEGEGGRQLVSISTTSADVEVARLAPLLRAGAWWTLRIQILPDGRCGIAVNGRVVSLSTEPMRLDGAFRLRLGDESLGARLLHGPLDVWTGVRTDITWSTPTDGVVTR